MYQYIKSKIVDNKALFDDYFNRLTLVDDFWETHIISGEFYSIQFQKRIVGFFQYIQAGCWYQNIISKKALESAGFVSKSRLLNISF